MTDQYLQRHEAFLAQTLSKVAVPAKLILQAINYSLFPGGKRIRPILVYLAGDLIGVDKKVLDVIAAAIELTHCYSLIHDDLPAMDNDDLRRGRPSCHKAFDEATAILVGDGLQALAVELLLTDLPPLLHATQVIKITQHLVQASGISGMVSGQSLDLSELSKTNLGEQQLQNIHQLKTGKLILACFEMVLAAKDTKSQLEQQALISYAQHIGLVFQIQDDYLDQYAPSHFLGKNRSSDLANQKTTFANLFSKQQLEEKIGQHYEIATASLSLFGEQAKDLIALTQKLQQRSQLDRTNVSLFG